MSRAYLKYLAINPPSLSVLYMDLITHLIFQKHLHDYELYDARRKGNDSSVLTSNKKEPMRSHYPDTWVEKETIRDLCISVWYKRCDSLASHSKYTKFWNT